MERMHDRNRFFTIHRVCARVFRCLDRGTLRALDAERKVCAGGMGLSGAAGRHIARDRALGVHSRPGEGLGHRAHRRGDRAQPRRHPALRRGRVDALRARRRQGRLAERQGRHGRRAAPRRRYDQAWRNGAALSRAGRRAARHIAAQAPPDRAQGAAGGDASSARMLPARAALPVFLHDGRRGARLHRALVRTAHCHGMVLLFCDAQHFRARV